jgi:deoxyribodipyrimidine photo-lyase
MTGDGGARRGSSDTGETGAEEPVVPAAADIPSPVTLCGDETATGYVVWHRKHLRTDDHRALSTALADGDVVCPLFVFDPTFYAADGLACDARLRFLHEAVGSLDTIYATVPVPTTSIARTADQSDTQSAGRRSGPLGSAPADGLDAPGAIPAQSNTPGLTIGYGDPIRILSRFVASGWSVLTMATPTSRYGQRRDDRARSVCGDAIEYVSGDGLVRDQQWSRVDWQAHIEEWLGSSQHSPAWDDGSSTLLTIDTGVAPALVDHEFGIDPQKTQVPSGTHRVATSRLRDFVDRIHSYPGSISAPQDARDGTSGLSPYLTFGLLSVRQVHQHVDDDAPACRGREMFTSRLFWNLHYNQKLADWPGWTDRAVNPVLEGRNEDTHDPALVEAWKQGRTGFPMVDASMRCLRQTGWLNFRMRAMCASFFTHILQQPWWIGADWYHHHLIDSDVGVNYTQWQSQAGLIGKPSQRVYNPRKQVRDQDPSGEWITRWVPELEPLPENFLDRPERAPLSVQADCGVRVGEEYPHPVVDFEARREAFWSRYERLRPEAARALGRRDIARRASFSGGYSAARAIAEKHGYDADETTAPPQASLAEAVRRDPERATGNGSQSGTTPPRDGSTIAERGVHDPPATDGERVSVPTGAGRRAGEPSPDDRTAVTDQTTETGDGRGSDGGETTDDTEAEQTSIREFE